MKYHYTYLIQHKTEDKRYIGVRSSICLPTEDTKYWGSSKHIPNNVQENHVKIILKLHNTRKEAVEHEIYLHRINKVASNPKYYNRALQTSTGFDTSGVSIPKSEEHKLACSVAQKRLSASPGYINPRKGAVLSDRTKYLISETKRKNGLSKSVKNNKFSPWFITDLSSNITTVIYDQTKDEYAKANGLNIHTLRSACFRSKARYTIKRGVFKNCILGNIEEAREAIHLPNKPLLKSAWYISCSTFSTPFYYTTQKEYALQNNINPQAVADAIHISSGKKEMKRGPFKGLILGKIT